MNLKKFLCLVAYYSFAKHLPASTSSMTHWTRKIRRAICRPIFDYCGENVNVEKGANFSTGGGYFYLLRKWTWRKLPSAWSLAYR